ncbi:MAG: MATE family efflux transporter [Melioribacteraceae bacterium]|nr:MATE family efflux transporter [Melioribacteraceae bacterium]MCO6473780.1 MATE family efflux transporter [Melioribacteraceae bacterium]MDD3558297.1 MATE family efflux transporter [Melioribacteraceae bacterium]
MSYFSLDTIKSESRKLLKLAVPVSIGQLGHVMMGVVDSIMVGKVGAAPLAAASLVTGLFFLILVLGFGMTMAIPPLVAYDKGSGNIKQCGIVLREGFIVNTFYSLLLMMIIVLAADLIPYMNQTPEVTSYAVSYMKILGASAVPMILFQNHRSFVEGLSDVTPPMIIAVAANFLNAFLNWLLIFGNLGFQPLGLDGAGYATFATRFLMMLSMIGYVHLSGKYSFYFAGQSNRKIDIKMIKKIVRLGIPSGFQHFFEVSAFSFAAVMIGWMGTVELAAHQIALNLASVTFMIVMGISSAGTIRVAEEAGTHIIERTRTAGFTALLLSASIMACNGIMFFLLRKVLPEFYISNAEVIEKASVLLIIAALFQIFDGVQASGLGILRGLKDVKIPMITTFISYWAIGIPLGYFLGIGIGLNAVGVWIGLMTALGLVAATLSLRFNFLSKNILYD